MSNTAKIEFHREVVAGSARLKKDGYNPSRFLQMVAEVGGPEAAKQLLQTSSASDGFTTLWTMGRLDMSVEAMALLPWYSEIFSATERSNAETRLVAHGFNLQAYLQRAIAVPPSWV